MPTAQLYDNINHSCVQRCSLHILAAAFPTIIRQYRSKRLNLGGNKDNAVRAGYGRHGIHFTNYLKAVPRGCSVKGIGLPPLHCWARGFKSRWGHGFSSLVFIVRSVGSLLCDMLITRSEESYRVCVVSIFAWSRSLHRFDGLCPSWAVAPETITLQLSLIILKVVLQVPFRLTLSKQWI